MREKIVNFHWLKNFSVVKIMDIQDKQLFLSEDLDDFAAVVF